MRTLEEIKKYLQLDTMSDLAEFHDALQAAAIFESKYKEQLESGRYGYALHSDFYSIPHIIEDPSCQLIKIEELDGIVAYKKYKDSSIDMEDIRKACDIVRNVDEWGVAELWYDNKGVEYNYCIDDGENCSAIYKTEINEKTGYRETDYNSFIHYEVDFNNPSWKEILINELDKAFEKLHKIGNL